MRFILLTAIIIFNSMPALCQHQYLEKEYQKVWCTCNNGVIEYTLQDGARVDCVTQTHAIEFDFANKWAESIGQSLYYGKSLCKKPGIVLIMENPGKDMRYLKRLKTVTDMYNISVWIMTPDDMKNYILINNKK